MWKGAAMPCIEIFLLPTSHNLGKDECGNAVERGGSNKPTPAQHEEDVLLANSLTESWPEHTLLAIRAMQTGQHRAN